MRRHLKNLDKNGTHLHLRLRVLNITPPRRGSTKIGHRGSYLWMSIHKNSVRDKGRCMNCLGESNIENDLYFV